MNMEEAQLEAIVSSSASTEEKRDRYMAMLEDKLGMKNVPFLKIAVVHLMREEVPQAISRKVMAHIAPLFVKMLSKDLFQDMAEYTTEQIRSNPTFEEADQIIRQNLFQYYKGEGDYLSAANALAGITLENSSSLSQASPEERANAVANHYVMVAETFLVDPDQTVEAENYVNKAMTFMSEVTDRNLRLRYKVTHSQVRGPLVSYLQRLK